MPSVELYHGDNLDIFPLIEDESVDTVITDPPYGLKFMGKEWDTFPTRDRGERLTGSGNPTDARGFGGNVAYGKTVVEARQYQEWCIRWAAECLRVSKPGAMLCAFGGTRTHHRLMCAIEDAGWEIRDVLMWLYGSGFPKSHDVSKAIDKAAGAERQVVGQSPNWRPAKTHGGAGFDQLGQGEATINITSPATDAAALWDGYGTALKPAYEPIILAMKPLPGTFAQNALEYGVAGLWVDGCRVGMANGDQKGQFGHHRPQYLECETTSGIYGNGFRRAEADDTQGRWPANLLLSHAPGCECVGVRKVRGTAPDGADKHPPQRGSLEDWRFTNYARTGYASPDGTETVEAWNCVPECPVRLLDEQSGEGRAGKPSRTGTAFLNDGLFMPGQNRELVSYEETAVSGASRFFTRFHYSAKASRAERELGLLGHILCIKCGGLDTLTHINPKTGKEEKCRRNGHPTVKPLDVCRWLCRLTRTPTRGVVLDPFAGSGRISMAAILEGRDTIGIELERPSFEIAQAAVQWAEEQVPNMVQGELEHA